MKQILSWGFPLSAAFVFGFFLGQQSLFFVPETHKSDLHTAAAAGDYNATLAFLNKGVSPNARDNFLQTPLLYAAWWGHRDVVNLLVLRGADVNIQNSEGFTGLYWAVNHGHCGIAEILLKAGAKPSLPALNKWTALHEAAVHSDDRMYALLVRYGANEEAKDAWGKTPTYLRAQRKKGDL